MKLCFYFRAAGIQCHVVGGIRKSIQYEVGDAIIPDDLAGVWNAVLVDGEWRLIDILWASLSVVRRWTPCWEVIDEERVHIQSRSQHVDEVQKCHGSTMYEVDEFFFLTDPKHLIYSHLSAELKWQLLKEPLKLEAFERNPFLKSYFFKYLQSSDSIIDTTKGEAKLLIELIPSNVSRNMEFVYKLCRKLDDGVEEDITMDRCVLYQKTPTHREYYIRFPTVGHYKMEIYGGEQDAPDLDLLCAYAFTCDIVGEKAGQTPDAPFIG